MRVHSSFVREREETATRSEARHGKKMPPAGKDEQSDALRQAARTNNLEKLKSLISKGTDVNTASVGVGVLSIHQTFNQMVVSPPILLVPVCVYLHV